MVQQGVLPHAIRFLWKDDGGQVLSHTCHFTSQMQIWISIIYILGFFWSLSFILFLCTIVQICSLRNCRSGAFVWKGDLGYAVRLAVTRHTVIISPTSISNCHVENCVLHIHKKSEILHRGCLFPLTGRMGEFVLTDLKKVFIKKPQSALHMAGWKVEFHLVLLELLGDTS